MAIPTFSTNIYISSSVLLNKLPYNLVAEITNIHYVIVFVDLEAKISVSGFLYLMASHESAKHQLGLQLSHI
jgi:hypothetical protein